MCALLCRCICRPGMKRGWLPTTFGCNGRESSRLIWVWLGQRSYYFPLDHQAEDTQPSAARAYTNTHVSIISLRGQLQALPVVNTHTHNVYKYMNMHTLYCVVGSTGCYRETDSPAGSLYREWQERDTDNVSIHLFHEHFEWGCEKLWKQKDDIVCQSHPTLQKSC